MSGLDTSQAITDQAALGDEKLLHHPHLELPEPAAPVTPAEDGPAPAED
jgi:hypothetical protein